MQKNPGLENLTWKEAMTAIYVKSFFQLSNDNQKKVMGRNKDCTEMYMEWIRAKRDIMKNV